jgi:hypothetical protein
MGTRDLDWDARKTGPTSDIHQGKRALVIKGSDESQGTEEVMYHNLPFLLEGGQIHTPIPPEQLLCVKGKGVHLLGIESQADLLGSPAQEIAI